jgi:hypothetical protein
MDGVEFNIINYMHSNGSQVKEDRDQTIGITPHVTLLPVRPSKFHPVRLLCSFSQPCRHPYPSHTRATAHTPADRRTPLPRPLSGAVVYSPTLQFSIGGGSSPAARGRLGLLPHAPSLTLISSSDPALLIMICLIICS